MGGDNAEQRARYCNTHLCSLSGFSNRSFESYQKSASSKPSHQPNRITFSSIALISRYLLTDTSASRICISKETHYDRD
ncbi:hypothetical protein CEXT_617961 [Caerostris extrusa]|uniref:Uncharacterized protein n=1 Tax=Caerostris extrusa TaxID=172846 RepID=A0AAV4QT17_CAEEX|nr:hypothetical protein CEXT_617961 [Caerostris extrusa]